MLFIVERGYNDAKPFEHPKLKKEEVYEIQVRTVDDPKKLLFADREGWYQKGENHRTIESYDSKNEKWIARDLKVKKWTADFEMDDVLELLHIFGDIHMSDWQDRYSGLDGDSIPYIFIEDW